MEEKLTCSQCSKTWSRVRSRGRKPVLCPKCVASNTTPPVQTQKPTKPLDTSKPDFKDQLNDDKSKLALVYQSLYPVPSRDDDQLKNQNPNGSTWKCDHCGYTIKIGVILSDIPTHKCNENSVRRRTLHRIS